MFMSALKSILDSGAVKRWHVARVINPQTNADHCWGAAAIACVIAKPHINEDSWGGVLEAILFHDAPEIVTGDIPSQAKWDCTEMKGLLEGWESQLRASWGIADPGKDGLIQAITKICDCCETAHYAIIEASMGNKAFGASVVERMRAHIINLKAKHKSMTVDAVCCDALGMIGRWEGDSQC